MVSLGRWNAVDLLADEQHSFTPYHSNYNNPVNYVDFNGLIPTSINICPTCPNGSEYDEYRESKDMYYYQGDGIVTTVENVVVTEKRTKTFQYVDQAAKHFNGGINDIAIGLGVEPARNAYNENHKVVSKKYYDGKKSIKKVSNRKVILPKPGIVRQYLKRVLSKNKKSSLSRILKKAGIIGTGLQIAKITADITSDGEITGSSIVDGGLLVITGITAITAGPAAAAIVGTSLVVYSVLDYTFDIGGWIDKNTTELHLYDK